MVNRVEITDEAADVVARLKGIHGALMFHQSGGCCDGSSPMCYPAGDFRVGPQDVLLGEIAGCQFYIGAAQFEYWQHTQLIIDVVPGRGSGFSVEAPEGVRFLTRSRVFTDRGSRRTRGGRTAVARGLMRRSNQAVSAADRDIIRYNERRLSCLTPNATLQLWSTSRIRTRTKSCANLPPT